MKRTLPVTAIASAPQNVTRHAAATAGAPPPERIQRRGSSGKPVKSRRQAMSAHPIATKPPPEGAGRHQPKSWRQPGCCRVCLGQRRRPAPDCPSTRCHRWLPALRHAASRCDRCDASPDVAPEPLHNGLPRSLNALPITDSELKLIASAATIGDRNHPVNG